MSVAGIIFANLNASSFPQLTRERTAASIPFACRYRLIDFALSNMVNSDITNISVITQFNYRSLMDHIGSGKDWDLARRKGGIMIFPPMISAYESGLTSGRTTRLEALKSISHTIMRLDDDYVVMYDSDSICNIDIGSVINDHIKSGADITLTTQRAYLTDKSGLPLKTNLEEGLNRILSEKSNDNLIIIPGDDGKVSDIFMQPDDFSGYCDISLNITVISKTVLQSIVMSSIAHGYTSFTHDILSRNPGGFKINSYRFNGYFSRLNTFADYFACSMNIVSDPATRMELFSQKARPIYTKVRNSPPTKYGKNAETVNSLIADGCMISGKVESSILFRGVRIPQNTCVKNSILFQDTIVGEGCSLNCIVSDKNVVIRDGRVLSGYKTQPYYISKGMML